MRKYRIHFAVILFSLSTGLVCSMGYAQPAVSKKAPPPGDPKEVLATVNGEKIFREEAELLIAQADTMTSNAAVRRNEEQKKAALRGVLNDIIEQKLVLQEAAKAGIVVGEYEAGQLLNQLRQRFRSDKEMDEFLKKGKTSIALRMKSDRENMMKIKMESRIYSQLPISDGEIEGYWKQNGSGMVQDMVKVRHLSVETEAEANEMIRRIKQGESFEDLAKQHSLDVATKELGGDMGWKAKNQLFPLFGEAAFALKVGEISPPVKTTLGYHVIRVDDKKKKEEQTMEFHKEFIRSTLQYEKWLRFKKAEWLNSLRAKAKIWNKLDQ